jgi:hypothetical protein
VRNGTSTGLEHEREGEGDMGRNTMLDRKDATGAVFVAVVALAACSIFATGCESIQYATGQDLGSPDSTELKSVQFDDIPVPFGFRLQERLNQSLTYEYGTMRVGRLQYRGEGLRPAAAAEFYKNQMPLAPNGWAFENELDQSNQRILSFHKKPYRCTVTINEEKTSTYITVEVDTLYES